MYNFSLSEIYPYYYVTSGSEGQEINFTSTEVITDQPTEIIFTSSHFEEVLVATWLVVRYFSSIN